MLNYFTLIFLLSFLFIYLFMHKFLKYNVKPQLVKTLKLH